MGKITSKLYNASRFFGRLASKSSDLDALLSLNPMKIVKRKIRKKIGSRFAKTGKKLENKFR